MSLEEFKDIISGFFFESRWDVILEDDVLRVKYRDTEKELTLNRQEFEEVNSRLQACKLENYYEIMSEDKRYEVLVVLDSTRRVLYEEELTVEDQVNHINYSLRRASKEMVMSVMFSKGAADIMRRFMARYNTQLIRIKLDRFEKTSLLDFITEEVFRYLSLTITTANTTSLDKFKSYAVSYAYAFMYNSQLSMSLYDDTQMEIDIPRNVSWNRDFEYPKNFYNPELVSYYAEAISSTVLPHKYLAFYHILEYFYERIFSENQIEEARKIITDVSFSYKRDKDIMRLIKGVQQKSPDNDVTINEKSALNLLIKKHVHQDELRAKLIDRNGMEYLNELHQKVSFSDGSPIIFSSDESQFVTSLTDRIYKTRNSIVHSKESLVDERKNKKYKRVRDDQELKQEIALIQVVAEIMINEESKQI